MIRNTENTQMLVYYLNKPACKNGLTKIAESAENTYTLIDLYKVLRPAFIEAPEKPYTNNKIADFNNLVRTGRAKAKTQAKKFLAIINRNETIYGWGGGIRQAYVKKEVLTDEDLEELLEKNIKK